MLLNDLLYNYKSLTQYYYISYYERTHKLTHYTRTHTHTHTHIYIYIYVQCTYMYNVHICTLYIYLYTQTHTYIIYKQND